MGEASDGSNVRHVHEGIGRALEEHSRGASFERLLDRCQVPRVDIVDGQPSRPVDLLEEAEGTAVQLLARHETGGHGQDV